MTRKRLIADTLLYGMIAALMAAQTYVAEGLLPKDWSPWIGIFAAGLIAMKAKLSKSTVDAPPADNGSS